LDQVIGRDGLLRRQVFDAHGGARGIMPR